MKTIPIEQLDPSASQWLRQAAQDEPIVVTENGKPILTLTITPPEPPFRGMAARVLLPEFEKIMNKRVGGTGITEILEQDREDRW